MASFIEAILRAKVAQICSHVGYNAITTDSANILVDIYRRTIVHLVRHCKEAANNNRRVEPTIIDLVQAYEFVGLSITELQEYVQNVKLPFEKEISKDESKPSNRIQRDLSIDDLLEAKKSLDSGGHDEDGENKLIDERGTEDEDAPQVPLLKDVYQEIANQFPSPSTPIKADKLRIKREEKPAIPRIKIAPLDPAVAEPPSFLPLLEGSKDERSIPVTIKTSQAATYSDKKKGPKANAAAKVAKTKAKQRSKLKTKLKTELKAKGRGRKTKTPPADVKEIQPPDIMHLPSHCPSPVASTPPLKPPTPKLEPSPKIRTPAPIEETITKTPTPPLLSTPSSKQTEKGKKKKKKSDNQFTIVTESVTASADVEGTEWLCPICSGPDNGDLMLQCEGKCELWFHLKCTGLKKEPKEDENWECNNCNKPKANKLASISKQPSKASSKKRDKTVLDVHVKLEARTPTPQSSTPTSVKRRTPSPPTVTCSSSDDLCPECQLPDDGTLMIQCDDPFCAKWFHGKCVNVLSAPEDNDSWFCKVCVDKQQSAFKRRRRVK